MATSLYEVLELDRTATPEQIRKAYKKRALQTHPDRLPPSTSAADREASSEEFRKVNNAYEVLNDPTKRQQYDTHGVWPPPTVPAGPPNASTFPTDPFANDPFFARTRANRSRRHTSDPFSNDPFSSFGGPSPFDNFFGPSTSGFHQHHAHSPFGSSGGSRNRNQAYDPFYGFTDPFQIFNEFFAGANNMRNAHGSGGFSDPFDNDPFLNNNHQSRRSTAPAPANSFGSFGFGGSFGLGGMMNLMLGGGLGGSGSTSFTSSSSSSRGGPGGRWVSERTMTRTVNGVTQSVWTRTDSEGNEHVTYTLPDGRQRTTINGIEQDPHHQHSNRYIQQQPSPAPNVSASRSSSVRSGHSHRSSHRHAYDDDPPVIPSDTRSSHRDSHRRSSREEYSSRSAKPRIYADYDGDDDDESPHLRADAPPVIPTTSTTEDIGRKHGHRDQDHHHHKNPLHYLHRHRHHDRAESPESPTVMSSRSPPPAYHVSERERGTDKDKDMMHDAPSPSEKRKEKRRKEYF